MTAPAATPAGGPALGTLPAARIAAALRGNGLWLDLGALVLRVRSKAPALAAPLQAAYRHHPFVDSADWADVHAELRRGGGWRRWLRPQVSFACDGAAPFDPFPGDTALPLLEWGANWLIGERMHHLLLLHAAALLERDGRALLMPALPGSGKSTLAAALSLRGWRLLSDEFGAFDLERRRVVAVLKPVALKNASIDVIRAFEPHALIGPAFPKTRKGTVAHLAAGAETVARRHEAVAPGAIVLPRWEAGSATRLEPLGAEAVFGALAFNAFNYRLLGADGFDAAVALARACPAWQLVYGDLANAVATIDALWRRAVAAASAANANSAAAAAADQSEAAE